MLTLHVTNLKHLDEGNAEVKICEIAADQAQAEEEANRDNRTEVDTASHLDGFSPVKVGRVSGENLGHDGRKAQVIGCQNDRIP